MSPAGLTSALFGLTGFEALPDPDEEEFYLADLVGLSARERIEGIERPMGTVLAVHDYGAGTSLEIGHVGRSIMLPFTRACVPEIDLAAGRLHDRMA